MTISEQISQTLSESKVVSAHYKDSSGNVKAIFFNADNGRVWCSNQNNITISPSNLMFMQQGSTKELTDLLVDGVKVTEPTTDKEMASEVSEITGLKFLPGKGY